MSAATRVAPIAFVIITVALVPETVAAAVCPAGDFVVTSRKGAPVRNIHVDLAAKEILNRRLPATGRRRTTAARAPHALLVHRDADGGRYGPMSPQYVYVPCENAIAGS
jgi:hypothetical protein